MGNKMCCDDSRKEENPLDKIEPDAKRQDEQLDLKYEEVENRSVNQVQHVEEPVVHKEVIPLPELSSKVSKVLHEHDFYQQEINDSHRETRRYGDDVYDGPLDNHDKPNGFGKMYKQDGSIYVGHFLHGKAEGKGAFIFKDGSFYNGDFVHNTAESNSSHYQSEKLEYFGGFKNNTFEGQGREKGSNHSFVGQYQDGHKHKGVLSWEADHFQYSYEGNFNHHGQFHGSGVLREPSGTYDGFFLNGIKEGDGVYRGNNGITYKGEYKNGQKNGQGLIQNRDGLIQYEGQFAHGVPHGKGYSFVRGQRVESNWKEGIDSSLLNDQK